MPIAPPSARRRGPVRLVAGLGAALVGLLALPGVARAAYNPTPTANWSPTSGTVYALARVGDAIVMGGSFTALRSPDDSTVVSRNRLAAVSATTGALLPWNPGANDTVRALEPSADGSAVYVGGLFTSAAGASRSRIAAVRMSDGAPVAGFTASTNSTVFALKRIGATLYVGGSFTSIDSAARQRLAALSATTGALVTGFTANADNSVLTLQDSPTAGNLVVGGRFTTLGGAAHVYLGQVDTSTGAPRSWRADVCTGAGSSNLCYVYGTVHDGSSIYAAVGGSGGRLVALTAAGGGRRWTAYTDGDVQAVGIQDGLVYAGGHFDTEFGNQPRNGMAVVNSATGVVDPNFATRFPQGLGVFAVLTGPTGLALGGGFTNVSTRSGEQRYTFFPTR